MSVSNIACFSASRSSDGLPSPPMLPGVVQTEEGFYRMESGSCGSGVITDVSECESAADALGLSDTTATDLSHVTSIYPPGCVFLQEHTILLFLYGSGITGDCSSDLSSDFSFAQIVPESTAQISAHISSEQRRG